MSQVRVLERRVLKPLLREDFYGPAKRCKSQESISKMCDMEDSYASFANYQIFSCKVSQLYKNLRPSMLGFLVTNGFAPLLPHV
ncbi:unnamed protein product [Dovyalis caffra]|uniref:Uncharacterized protein n=1 Tax=Dovyalis caffra TaxID=77055 RepID=A0AAV1R555_9ROSI|nr:unnamed protein product [Dovyalis caffra]